MHSFFGKFRHSMPGIATLVSVCCLAAPSASADIAKWNFDEIQQEDTVMDGVGNAHARIMGGVVPDLLQPGLYGKAILLDMARNHLLVDPEHAPNLSDDFTIRCVIFPFNVESYRTILWKGNRSNSPEMVNFYLGIRDKKIEFKSKDELGRWMVHSTERVLIENVWYDIAVYFSNGSAEITLNGEPCPTTSHTDEDAERELVPNDHPLIIGQGAIPRGDAFHFFGLIDEIKISEGRHLDRDAEWEERLLRYETEQSEKEKAMGETGKKQHEEWLKTYATVFQERAKSPDAPFYAVTLPSTRRINKSNDFLHQISGLTPGIQLSAAGNEYEGEQILVVSRPDHKTGKISVQFSDLVNESGNKIPASHASWGWIKSIATEKPDITVEFVGKIPDAIIEGEEFFEVEAWDFTPVFARFFIPSGTPAGLYQGSITLITEDFQEVLPVEMRVHPFDLPAKGSLRVSFSFFEEFYREWHNDKTPDDEHKRELFDYLLKYRIPPSNIYTNLPVYPELRFLKDLRDRTNFFTVQGWNTVISENEALEKVATYQATLDEIQKLGMSDSVYFYGVDEISDHLDKGLPRARQAHAHLSKHFPDLRTMQTSFPLPEIRPLYNVWIPLLNSFADSNELPVLEEIRKDSRELWWYAADLPLHPLPNFYLDYPVFDSRIIMTLTYKYNLDGILYWAINREWKTNMDIRDQWPNADWKPYIFHVSRGERKQRNGMGNLIYPRKSGGLYASLRLENIRDGLEDYEYLKMLENITTRLEAAKVSLPEIAEAKQLLKVPDSVATSVDRYNSNPSALLDYREQLAAMIVRLQGIEL